MDDKKDTHEKALSRRLLEYREQLFSYIMALVRDWHDAEELFQEVSLVILRKEQEGLEVRYFGAWSREIARRMILDFWKTRKRRDRILLSEDALAAVEDAFAARDHEPGGRLAEMLERLNHCLEKLPEHLQRLVHLRYRDQHSFKKIGRHIGKSSGAAQVTLSRTRVLLLDCMQRLGA